MKDLELSFDEVSEQRLRLLYEKRGYSRASINKFEDYNLYVENKSFLESDSIITFMDYSGNLMALKPDITLSIAKNIPKKRLESFEKVYYIDQVYRLSRENQEYRVVNQIGVELMGPTDSFSNIEIVTLALDSLEAINKDYILDISHTGFLSGLIDVPEVGERAKKQILSAVHSKSPHNLESILTNNEIDVAIGEKVLAIAHLNGRLSKVLVEAEKLVVNKDMADALEELREISRVLDSLNMGERVNLDFSVTGDLDYYNGLTLQGYIKGAAKEILSGGRYDKLMEKMGKDNGALGFAVYLSELSDIKSRKKLFDVDSLIRYNEDEEAGIILKHRDNLITQGEIVRTEKRSSPLTSLGFTFKRQFVIENGELVEKGEKMLSVALPKGRLGNKVYDIFAKIGYDSPDFYNDNRKLIIENAEKGIRYFLVKAADVAIYVERGAADVGVVGKDILLETQPDIYEILDLNIGKCRVAVAAPKDYEDSRSAPLKVATKYVNIAREYYKSQNRDIEIIRLSGSIELAPILNLSDVIVDIVETGSTLRENDLIVVKDIIPISARLIANKASSKFKGEEISKITNSLQGVIEYD